MLLIIEGHSYRFEMENICRLFLPWEKVTVGEAEDDSESIVALTRVEPLDREVLLTAALTMDGHREELTERVSRQVADERFECERRLGVLLYRLFVKHMDFTLPWGAVTGVRPVKLMRRMATRLGIEGAEDWLQKSLLVSPHKAALCRETLERENPILALSRPLSFSLYISIPFCPSRCDYCSFVSHTVERAARLIPDYVDCLCREIAHTGQIARQLGLRLETVYVGGGTPTTLSAGQLLQVLDTVADNFDLSTLREYTVEAGRPDTVTEEKLQVIRGAGITRISINPQTMRDEVLEGVGRRHTAAEFIDSFALARRCGFDNINADLIAGLPGDDVKGFESSLDSLLRLSPESVTVHALAMKRASNLVTQHRREGDEQAAQMTDSAARRLRAEGYHPYYLYRQSRTAGGAENTGWSKEGKEGLYNVYIMDETHTILACGAGAVTKLRHPSDCWRPDSGHQRLSDQRSSGRKIERVFNYKFPYEYIGRFDDMLQRKGRVTSFYDALLSQTKPETERD